MKHNTFLNISYELYEDKGNMILKGTSRYWSGNCICTFNRFNLDYYETSYHKIKFGFNRSEWVKDASICRTEYVTMLSSKILQKASAH